MFANIYLAYNQYYRNRHYRKHYCRYSNYGDCCKCWVSCIYGVCKWWGGGECIRTKGGTHLLICLEHLDYMDQCNYVSFLLLIVLQFWPLKYLRYVYKKITALERLWEDFSLGITIKIHALLLLISSYYSHSQWFLWKKSTRDTLLEWNKNGRMHPHQCKCKYLL